MWFTVSLLGVLNNTLEYYTQLWEQDFDCVYSVASDSVTLWTVDRQASLSMGFSRQGCWSGFPFSSLGDLSDPGIKPRSIALQADSLLTELPGKPGYELKPDIIYFRMKVKEEHGKAGLKLNI